MEFILPLQELIEHFSRLKSVGRKTAQRYAFNILEMSDDEVIAFATALIKAKKDVCYCKLCGNLTDKEICDICTDDSRQKDVICLVEDATDIMAIEQTREYNGLYHVLGGVISPSKGITPDKLRINELLERLNNESIKELIIATNSSLDGETTAMYISRLVSQKNIKVTRPASGIPVGADIVYADRVTLAHAFSGRTELK